MKRLLSTFKNFAGLEQKPTFDQAPLTGATQDLTDLRAQLGSFKDTPEHSTFNSDEEIRLNLKAAIRDLREIAQSAPNDVDTKPAFTAITLAALDYNETFSSGLLPAETLDIITEQIESDFEQSNIGDTTLLENLYERMIDNHLRTVQDQRDTMCAQMQHDTLGAFYIRNDHDLERFNDKMTAHITSAEALIEKLSQYGDVNPEMIEKVTAISESVNEFKLHASDYVMRVKEMREEQAAASFNTSSFPQRGSYKDLTRTESWKQGEPSNTNKPQDLIV